MVLLLHGFRTRQLCDLFLFLWTVLVPPGIDDQKKENQAPKNQQNDDARPILPQLLQPIKNRCDHSESLHHLKQKCDSDLSQRFFMRQKAVPEQSWRQERCPL